MTGYEEQKGDVVWKFMDGMHWMKLGGVVYSQKF
jgi:hypothetical protein